MTGGELTNMEQLNIHLNDGEWEFQGVTHDRQIVRAIVFDDDGYF